MALNPLEILSIVGKVMLRLAEALKDTQLTKEEISEIIQSTVADVIGEILD